MSKFTSLVYLGLSYAQCLNTVRFWVENDFGEKMRLSVAGDLIICIAATPLSAVLWPISFPLMVMYEKKEKAELKELLRKFTSKQ